MPTLAPKLPYTHPFSGGYPRLGGQLLPSDPDAIDYLTRVAAADGAAVEVGVAMAVDQFVKGCKADSAGYAGDPTRTVWDAIQACCIMCGARTISGALVPLKRPYGSELVNIDALPTPTVLDAFGSAGAWDASTRTFSNTATSTSSTYPRMRLGVGMTSGKQYRISGRLSGDVAKLYGVRVADFTYLSIDAATGSFDSVVSAGYAYIEFLLNGTFGTSSIRIESLSIREDSFTPTPYNFVSSDYSRTTGLAGDGATKYLDSNRANDADAANDKHISSYISALPTVISCFIGSAITSPSSRTNIFTNTSDIDLAVNSSLILTFALSSNPVFAGVTLDQATMSARYNGSTQQASVTAVWHSLNSMVFARDVNGSIGNFSDARLAFYSSGSAIPDLAALDNRVTQLVTGIKFHSLTGLVATDYDPDTVAYIVAAYESGGTL